MLFCVILIWNFHLIEAVRTNATLHRPFYQPFGALESSCINGAVLIERLVTLPVEAISGYIGETLK